MTKDDENLDEMATLEAAPPFSVLPEAEGTEGTVQSNRALVTRVALLARNPKDNDAPRAQSLDSREGEARYEEVRNIAYSASSHVSEAFDWRIRRRVALKRINNELVDTEAAARFRREALITAWLDHPNILPIYDMVIKDDQPPRLIMKLIEGDTLTRHVDRLGTELATMDALLLTLQKACDAVQFAHDAGVIHRDLKPDNIMVGKHGQVYVMDWGIAKLITEKEAPIGISLSEAGAAFQTQFSGGLFGTPAYMAPEQATGRINQVDERTDVFGLGAVLYFILTGHCPYSGSRVNVILQRASRGEILRPKLRAPERPIRPELERLCMKALAHDPAERFPSVQAFSEALRTAQQTGGWFELRSFEAGSVIVAQGEPAREAFLISEGRCKVVQHAEGQAEGRLLRELGPGDAFGELGVFTGGPRSASVIALTQVEAQCIDEQSLKWAMEEKGPFSILTRALANRFLEREAELDRKQP